MPNKILFQNKVVITRIIIFFIFSTLIACGGKTSKNENSRKNAELGEDKSQLVSPWIEMTDSAFLSMGNQYAKATFDTLSKTLQQVIQTKGFVEAIQFCNIQALPITTSQEENAWVSVKRTSLQVRNQENTPSQLEKMVLLTYADDFENQREMKERLERDDQGNVWFFKPIMIQPLCLNCHGSIEYQIQEKTLIAIQESYPKDHAIGYANGDFRGIWSIAFRIKS